MERMDESRLTPVELSRKSECEKEFGCKGFLYYVTEWSPFGYYTIWSKYPMAAGEFFNKETMRDITDVDEMIMNM